MLDELWPHRNAIAKIQGAQAADLVVWQLSIFAFVEVSTLP